MVPPKEPFGTSLKPHRSLERDPEILLKETFRGFQKLGPKPYEFIVLGARGPKPYQFIGFESPRIQNPINS